MDEPVKTVEVSEVGVRVLSPLPVTTCGGFPRLETADCREVSWFDIPPKSDSTVEKPLVTVVEREAMSP